MAAEIGNEALVETRSEQGLNEGTPVESASDHVVSEVLVEEVSIDGMCGVY
jgi:mycofactocin precursor